MPFKFGCGQAVYLVRSGEYGEVIGRAEYSNNENRYFVRYVNGTGCQMEEWQYESALTTINPAVEGS